MSVNAYTEDQLVEQPAIGLFAESWLANGGGGGTPSMRPARCCVCCRGQVNTA